MDGPPPPEIRHIDFSEYHPLDHALLDCRDYPGGRRRHLKYRWEFQWRDRLLAATLCRLGRHVPMTWYRRSDDGGMKPCHRSCQYCDKDMSN